MRMMLRDTWNIIMYCVWSTHPPPCFLLLKNTFHFCKRILCTEHSKETRSEHSFVTPGCEVGIPREMAAVMNSFNNDFEWRGDVCLSIVCIYSLFTAIWIMAWAKEDLLFEKGAVGINRCRGCWTTLTWRFACSWAQGRIWPVRHSQQTFNSRNM